MALQTGLHYMKAQTIVCTIYRQNTHFPYITSFNISKISSLENGLQQPGVRKQVSAAARRTASSAIPISLHRVGIPISLMKFSKASMPFAANSFSASGSVISSLILVVCDHPFAHLLHFLLDCAFSASLAKVLANRVLIFKTIHLFLKLYC